MNTYNFVHLVLFAFDGRIHGRTKLQKTVYFLGALTGQLPTLGFRAHFYGPYSSEVAGAVNELQGFGFLRQEVSSRGSYDPRGFEVARYDYVLTPDGKLIAEEKTEDFPDDWEKIQTAANRLKTLGPDDYVALSIAAKTYYLLGEKGGRATFDELNRMTPQFGWTVTEEQMAKAGEFLKSLELIDLETAK